MLWVPLTISIIGLFAMAAYHKVRMRAARLENSVLRSKSEHLSMASHEVKNLALELSSIADDLKRAISNPPLSDEPLKDNPVVSMMYSDISSMFVISKTLGNFVFEFLEVNRMGNIDSLPVIISRLNLNNAIRDVIRIYKMKVNSRHIYLRINPQITSQEIFLDTDIVRVKQILLNIVGNAVKYTDTGGVEVNAYRDGKYVIIDVRDTGIGIPEKQIAKVMNGSRATNSGSREGNGVGLYAVKRIVSALRGTMKIESREDEGTRVIIRIPDGEVEDE